MMFIYGVDGIVHSPASIPKGPGDVKPVVSEQPVKKELKEESSVESSLKTKAAMEELAKDKVAVQDVINSMNNISQNFKNKVAYELDERSSSGFVVRVVSKDTGNVIKQFPPEEFLEMISKMHDFLGTFVDKKV